MSIIDDPRRPKLNVYLREVRDAMRLQAWDVQVGDRPPEDPGATISTDPQPRRWWAPVFVADSFWDQTRKEQRQDIVHELVHVATIQVWRFVHFGEWRQELPRGLFVGVDNDFRERYEEAVDFLARLIAPSMPMPPESWHPDE